MAWTERPDSDAVLDLRLSRQRELSLLRPRRLPGRRPHPPLRAEVYESGGSLYGLAVEDAIHCGVCKPKPEPVPMDFLEENRPARPATRRKPAAR
jgi:hypothetical protein